MARDFARGETSTVETQAEALDHPLTHSSGSFRRLVEELREQVRDLRGDLQSALDDLEVLGDPDALAVEVATVREQARREAADSLTLAVRAETAHSQAEQRAEAAEAAAATVTHQLALLREELASTRADLRAATTALQQVPPQRSLPTPA